MSAPRLGPYTLHAIETGTLALDGGAMFGIVPRTLWERRIAPDDRNRIPLHMRCLLAVGDDRVVLVDDGLGHKYDARFADLFAVDHSRHTLARSLAQAGVGAEDVTDVILTHLHFDHCGGSTYRDGDALKLTFPNARHHVQRAHWAWAETSNVRERASFLDENMAPLKEAGVLVEHDGPGEILPGIDVRLVNGHTEAQQVVLFRGDETALAFVADLLPTVHHLAPAWNMGYDIRPMETIAEKEAFLDEAEAKGWHLMFEHDPDVELASLVRTDRGITTAHARRLTDGL